MLMVIQQSCCTKSPTMDVQPNKSCKANRVVLLQQSRLVFYLVLVPNNLRSEGLPSTLN